MRRLLRAVMEQSQRPELIEQLEEIDVRLKAFHDRGIDFKEVVDGLDDSIMITDAEGTVLYINPAYTRNTEITEEDVLNRDVRLWDTVQRRIPTMYTQRCRICWQMQDIRIIT